MLHFRHRFAFHARSGTMTGASGCIKAADQASRQGGGRTPNAERRGFSAYRCHWPAYGTFLYHNGHEPSAHAHAMLEATHCFRMPIEHDESNPFCSQITATNTYICDSRRMGAPVVSLTPASQVRVHDESMRTLPVGGLSVVCYPPMWIQHSVQSKFKTYNAWLEHISLVASLSKTTFRT